MIIIPAIDLKNGKCVRLKQGRMDSSTTFNENPIDQALKWRDMGAKKIHVVDLDGSVGGLPKNLALIQKIVNSIDVPIELGGGIRNLETVRMYLDIGVTTVILGTMAAKNVELTLEILNKFQGNVAIGIDAKKGKVAVEGWTEATSIDASELGSYYDSYNPEAFIYTDIERDGMMNGPSFLSTRDFARTLKTSVILSGGVTTIRDVKNAQELEKDGVTGIIIGRALYEGSIDLKEAIAFTEGIDVSQTNNPMP
ncbi:MAG: 1-(5-phosphoribosyl)-5-[(5-phosphoribosylamino)methylideneamino]imidazole-4-carboxamide isomerase [Pseudomonadota bacterium]